MTEVKERTEKSDTKNVLLDASKISAENLKELSAVSYTHLDVYKRQASNGARKQRHCELKLKINYVENSAPNKQII